MHAGQAGYHLSFPQSSPPHLLSGNQDLDQLLRSLEITGRHPNLVGPDCSGPEHPWRILWVRWAEPEATRRSHTATLYSVSFSDHDLNFPQAGKNVQKGAFSLVDTLSRVIDSMKKTLDLVSRP
jgi:hypothetical protein